MDTVTHGLAGWLACRAIPFPDDHARKEGTAAAVVGSVLPDADNIASLFGSELYLRIHRGLSHSLFAVPATSLLVAFLFYRFGRWKDLKRLFVLTLFGQIFHVSLDLLNSYGTQIFQPFSNARVSFDILFVVDLLFTGIIVTGIAASRGGRMRRARAAVGALVVYVALAVGLHARAEGVLRDAAVEHGVPVKASYALPRLETVPIPDRLDVGWGRVAEAALDVKQPAGADRVAATSLVFLPLAGGPLGWNGFIDDGKNYLRAEVDPLSGMVAWKQRVARAQDLPEVQALLGLSEGRTFLWFARFPAVTVTPEKGRTVIVFSDLRFGGMPGRGPFRLKVIESPGRTPTVHWGNP